MPRIASIPSAHTKELERRRFLTQPSSWAKLGVMFAVVLLIVWLNVRGGSNDQKGVVAGATVTRNNEQVQTQTHSEVTDAIAQQEIPAETIAPAEETTNPVPLLQGPTAAETKVKDILQTTDYDLQMLLTTGKRLIDENKLSDAETVFTRATEIAPEYRDAWYLLGYTQLKEQNDQPSADRYSLNKAQWAVVSLTRALVLDPQAEQVKQLLDLAKRATE